MKHQGMLRGAAALLLVAGCSGPSEPDPIETYRLEVRAGAVEPRSLLLAIDGNAGEVTVLVGGSALSRVATGAPQRVLLIGDLTGAAVLEVDAATPDVPPTVTVLDASAGSAAGYRRLQAGEVELEWVGVR